MSKIQKRNDKIAEGSVMDLAKRRGEKVEAIMADADMIVMLDISSSMAQRLDGSYTGYYEEQHYSNTRFSEALKALEAIQRQYQGRVLVITFNNTSQVCLGGLPSAPSGGTNLLEAFRLAKNWDDTDMKFTLISDGEPGSPEFCIQEAATFRTPIDTIFIGNDNDQRGLDVMNKIAAASRGKSLGKVDVTNLGTETIKLLGGKS